MTQRTTGRRQDPDAPERKPWMVQISRGGGNAYESRHTNQRGAELQKQALEAFSDEAAIWHWDGQRWVLQDA